MKYKNLPIMVVMLPATTAQIAEACGMSMPGVREWMRELQAAGLVYGSRTGERSQMRYERCIPLRKPYWRQCFREHQQVRRWAEIMIELHRRRATVQEISDFSGLHTRTIQHMINCARDAGLVRIAGWRAREVAGAPTAEYDALPAPPVCRPARLGKSEQNARYKARQRTAALLGLRAA